MVNHGNSDSATVAASSNATNDSIHRKRAGDQTAVGSYEPESGGHIPAKGNVH